MSNQLFLATADDIHHVHRYAVAGTTTAALALYERRCLEEHRINHDVPDNGAVSVRVYEAELQADPGHPDGDNEPVGYGIGKRIKAITMTSTGNGQ